LALRERNHVSGLPINPEARIGKAIHSFIERAIRHAPSESDREELGRRLENSIRSKKLHLNGNESFPVIGNLLDAITPLQWVRKKSRALDAIHRSESSNERTSPPNSEADDRQENKEISLSDLESPGSWTEISIQDGKLRLKGRMDLVVMREGVVEIHDFKTGRIHERGSGQIKSSLVNQMWMYGLLVKRARPEDDISLFLHSDDIHEIPFTDQEQDRALSSLRSKREGLETDDTIRAEDVANPGKECSLCQFRHRCPIYEKYAAKHWEKADRRLPSDTWGYVEKMEKTKNEHINLTITDDIGHRVRILRLDRRRSDHIDVDEKLWFFGLKTVNRKVARQRIGSPKNFCEISRTRRADRAWSLRIYSGKRSLR
jgi:CRISPR/Cas system-associated exonuclease Cas4 (RecB family)